MRLLNEIMVGVDSLVYNAQDPFQKKLFQYIWIPLVQCIMDVYMEETNTRRNRLSVLPTGVSPNYAFSTPHLHEAEQCLIPVSVEHINHLKATYPETLFEYIEPELKASFDFAFQSLHIIPDAITLQNAWVTFTRVLACLEQMM